MGLMVKMHNGDVERFESAISWGRDSDGSLTLYDDGSKPVATFSQGWAAVFETSPPKTPGRIEVSGFGDSFTKGLSPNSSKVRRVS